MNKREIHVNPKKLTLGAIILITLLVLTQSVIALETYTTTVTAPSHTKYTITLTFDQTFHKNTQYWVTMNITNTDFGENVTAIYQVEGHVNIFKQKPAQPDSLDHDNYITGGIAYLNMNKIVVTQDTIFKAVKNITVDVSMLDETQTYFVNVLLVTNERITGLDYVPTYTLLVWEGWISAKQTTSQTTTSGTPIPSQIIPLTLFIITSVILRQRKNHTRKH